MRKHPMLSFHSHKTERLILRQPTSADLEAIFAIHGDPRTNRFNPNGPQKSIEDAETMLGPWLAHWEEHGFGYWVIATQNDPTCIIGVGGLTSKLADGERYLNLYFRFAPEGWGKGYASEMAKAALHLGCQLSDYTQIKALTRTNNAPSIKTLERLGLKREGTIADGDGTSYWYSWECPQAAATR